MIQLSAVLGRAKKITIGSIRIISRILNFDFEGRIFFTFLYKLMVLVPHVVSFDSTGLLNNLTRNYSH